MLHGLVMLIGPLQTWLSLIRLHTLGQKRRGLHTNVSHFGNVRIIFRNEMTRRCFRNEVEALDQPWLFSVSGLDDPDLP